MSKEKRAQYLNEIDDTDSNLYQTTKEYSKIMCDAFELYYAYTKCTLEDFLLLIDNSCLLQDLIDNYAPLDTIYDNVDYLFKLLLENNREDIVSQIKQHLLGCEGIIHTPSPEDTTISISVLTALTRIAYEHKINTTTAMQHINIANIDMYAWDYLDNIPAARKRLTLDFKLNFEKGLTFDNKPVLKKEGV